MRPRLILGFTNTTPFGEIETSFLTFYINNKICTVHDVHVDCLISTFSTCGGMFSEFVPSVKLPCLQQI